MAERLAMSFAELADRVGVSPRSIQNWVARGDLAAIKVGRRTLVTTKEAERWLASRPTKNTGKGK